MTKSASLPLAVLALVSAVAHADGQVASVTLRISPDSAGYGRTYSGVVYSTASVRGRLAALDSSGRELPGDCPVIVTEPAVGLTAIAASDRDWSVTLHGAESRAPAELFGSYYGLRLGVAVTLLGADGMIAVNSRGVYIADFQLLQGIGLDLSVPWLTISPDESRGCRLN